MARSGQQELFNPRPMIFEESPARLFAEVVFNRPVRTTYSYAVPRLLEDAIGPGKRVLAPFGKGNHRTTGYCVKVSELRPDGGTLKMLHNVMDETSLVSLKMLELTRWMADYYCCAWGQVLEAVLPRAVKSEKGTVWALLLHPLFAEGKDPRELTPKQRRAFELLLELGRPAEMREITAAARCGPDVVKVLLAKGWVTMSRERRRRRGPPRLSNTAMQEPLSLTGAQKESLDKILQAMKEARSECFLLHGVTGSGKTEVYLQAIAENARAGREAIVLVPEISLTPQTIQRFRQRFDRVAVLHSHLSEVDRNAYWRRIAAGEVDVVVGARSALFAPCPRLGLIVVDEEHETTFKQENVPRYHARTVAVQRAKVENVPLILGSATPSLESWRAAQTGGFTLLSLPERVGGQPLPRVQLIDMREEYKAVRSFQAISRPLVKAVQETVDAGGQVILLLNRRGFSTSLLCPLCGYIEMCRHCDVVLTYHKQLSRIVCHSCDAEFAVPEKCAKCEGRAIKYGGVGTEKLEEEVRQRFPNYTCARMDSDTMRSLVHYERVLNAFRDGEVQILLGTQMIAKGLDFPNVHLVGVVAADAALNLPDFRAAERTFQLIAQVAGRTGRSQTPGRVLVQSFNPDDRSVLAASRHDFLRFAEEELPLRQSFKYPPFYTLCRIIVRAKSESTAASAAERMAEKLRLIFPKAGDVRLLGPAPAPIPRLKDYYRMHFQIQAKEPGVIQTLLDEMLKDLELPADAEFAIDVDPIYLM